MIYQSIMNIKILDFLKNKVFYKENRLLRDVCIREVNNEDIEEIIRYINRFYSPIIKEDKMIFNISDNITIEFYEWVWENVDLFTIQPEDIKKDIDYIKIIWFIMEISCLLEKTISICMEWEKPSLLDIYWCSWLWNI